LRQALGSIQGSRFGALWSHHVIQSERLKLHAFDIRVDVDPVQWFLNDKSATHSSLIADWAVEKWRAEFW
jgi:hypothetical protein